MGALFKTPKMPKIEPPTPLPDESQIQKERRRRMAKERSGASVQSTILSSGGKETLGA